LSSVSKLLVQQASYTIHPPQSKLNPSTPNPKSSKYHFQSNPKTHNETNIAKRVRKVPETEPKSRRAENGRTTAPPPQAEIGANTPGQAEIGSKTPEKTQISG
jgi:hypothetical protein